MAIKIDEIIKTIKEAEKNEDMEKEWPHEVESKQEEQPEPPAATLDELESMDMAMFANEEEPTEPQKWRIADDGCAEWALRKIQDERTELARLKELAEAQIARIEEKVAAAERRCENGTRFLTNKLAEYFETVPHKKTKTKESYRLLSGSLVKKLGGYSMEKDDEKLLEYLKASGNEDMIKVTEKPAWGEFKKRLEIVGGAVMVKDTGEIVECVTVTENPDTFTVEV